jgi:hypothetical protein
LASIIVVSYWRRNHLDRDDLIGRLDRKRAGSVIARDPLK